MNTPIINDPIAIIAEAVETLHPGVKYEAAYSPDIRDENGTIVCSCITFPNEEDGPDAVPVILLNSQAGIEVAAEAFAQELAHAVLGPDSLDHGPEYDAVVEAIAGKYNEISEQRFLQGERAQSGERNLMEQPEGGATDEDE